MWCWASGNKEFRDLSNSLFLGVELAHSLAPPPPAREPILSHYHVVRAPSHF